MSSLQGIYSLHLGPHQSQMDRLPRTAQMQSTVGPLLDLAALNGGTKDRSLAIASIGRALEEKGFFQVIHQPISHLRVHLYV